MFPAVGLVLEMVWLFLNVKGDEEVLNGPNLGMWLGRKGTDPHPAPCPSQDDPAVDMRHSDRLIPELLMSEAFVVYSSRLIPLLMDLGLFQPPPPPWVSS